MKELLTLIKHWIKLLSISGINSKQLVLDEMKEFVHKHEELLGNTNGTN